MNDDDGLMIFSKQFGRLLPLFLVKGRELLNRIVAMLTKMVKEKV
jgi:hypothetical protein